MPSTSRQRPSSACDRSADVPRKRRRSTPSRTLGRTVSTVLSKDGVRAATEDDKHAPEFPAAASPARRHRCSNIVPRKDRRRRGESTAKEKGRGDRRVKGRRKKRKQSAPGLTKSGGNSTAFLLEAGTTQPRAVRGGRAGRGGGRGGETRLQAKAGWDAGVGSSLSEEEKIGVVTDLVELFQQVNWHCVRRLIFNLDRGKGGRGGLHYPQCANCIRSHKQCARGSVLL